MRPIKPIALALQNSSEDRKIFRESDKKLVEIFVSFYDLHLKTKWWWKIYQNLRNLFQ